MNTASNIQGPSKGLEALAFVLAMLIAFALVLFGGRVNPQWVEPGILKVLTLIAPAIAWCIAAVRIAITEFLLPALKLVVVINDKQGIMGVRFWSVGVLVVIIVFLVAR